MERSLTLNPSRPPEVLLDAQRPYLLSLLRRFRSISDGEAILVRDAVTNVPCRPAEQAVLRELLIRAPALGTLSITAFVAAWDKDGAAMLNAGGRLEESPPRARKQK
jgi:hypothetical protein